MTSPRLRKILVITLGIVSFVALFPLSIRLSYLLFTRPFNPEWNYPILLVWPDHIEVRWTHSISEVSPRPKGETYTFNVPPERQTWVEEQVRKISYPQDLDLGLAITVEQLGRDRQRIQLESWGSAEMTGLIYEAQPDRIVPLHSRAADVMSALFIVVGVHLLLWGGAWFGVRLIWRLVIKQKQSQAAVVTHTI
jgi:hypothetical protein